ncbi:MAG: hypothetical protein AAF446_00730 [Pseudomonadota bacterium]
MSFPETVEDINEPVFLLAGGRDPVWDSGIMAANIAKTRADVGLVTETLIFEHAGHGLSGPPQNPKSASSTQVKAATWPALLAFLSVIFNIESKKTPRKAGRSLVKRQFCY